MNNFIQGVLKTLPDPYIFQAFIFLFISLDLISIENNLKKRAQATKIA